MKQRFIKVIAGFLALVTIVGTLGFIYAKAAEDDTSKVSLRIANLQTNLTLTDETEFWTNTTVPAAVDLEVSNTVFPTVTKLKVSVPKRGNFINKPNFGPSDEAASVEESEDDEYWYKTYIFHFKEGEKQAFKGTYRVPFFLKKDPTQKGDTVTLKAEILDGTKNDAVLHSTTKTYVALEDTYTYDDSAVYPSSYSSWDLYDKSNSSWYNNFIANYNVNFNETNPNPADTGNISGRQIPVYVSPTITIPSSSRTIEFDQAETITAVIQFPEGFAPGNGWNTPSEGVWDENARTLTMTRRKPGIDGAGWDGRNRKHGSTFTIDVRASTPKQFDTVYDFPVQFYVNKGLDKEKRLPDQTFHIRYKKIVETWGKSSSYTIYKDNYSGNGRTEFGTPLSVNEGEYLYINGHYYDRNNVEQDEVGLYHFGHFKNTNNGSSRTNPTGGDTTAYYALKDYLLTTNGFALAPEDKRTYFKYFQVNSITGTAGDQLDKAKEAFATNTLYGVAADGAKTVIKQNISFGEKVEINDTNQKYVSLSLEFAKPVILDNAQINFVSTQSPTKAELAKFEDGTYTTRQYYYTRNGAVLHHGAPDSHPATAENLTETLGNSNYAYTSLALPNPQADLEVSGNQVIEQNNAGTYFNQIANVSLYKGNWGPLKNEPRTGSVIQVLPEGYEYVSHTSAWHSDPIPAPEIVPNWNNTGKTALIYKDIPFLPSDSARDDLHINTRIQILKTAKVGESKIDTYFVYDRNNIIKPAYNSKQYIDDLDIDGDTNRQEVFQKLTSKIGYIPALEMSMNKTVTYDNKDDMGFTATGELGQPFYYKVTLKNNTISAVGSISVIDVLPYVGDHYLVPNAQGEYPQRGSQFATPLAAFLEDLPENARVIELFDIFYQVTPQGDNLESVRDGQWLTKDQVTDIKQVKSIKYSLKSGKVILSQQTIDVYLKAEIPFDKNLVAGSYAQNTSAFSRNDSVYLEGNRAAITFAKYEVMGTLFDDFNQDGIKDEGEKVVANRKVELIDENGDVVLDPSNQPIQGMTDDQGQYHFTFYKKGTYRIRFTKEDGEMFSPGSTTNVDGNNIAEKDGNSGTTQSFTFTPIKNRTTLNGAIASEKRDVEIIKHDQDGSPLAGATFELRQAGVAVQTQTTNNEGKIIFRDVPFGIYTIVETQAPQGYGIGESPAGREVTVGIPNPNLAPFVNHRLYPVTYRYQKVDGETRELPQAISDPATVGDYQVSDEVTYRKDATVTRKNPTSSSYDEQDGSGVTVGTWTLTWDKDSTLMPVGGAEFVGTWTFAEAPKAGVTYVYEKDPSATRELPPAISDPTTPGDYQVGDAEQYYVGATVTRKNPTSSSYDEQDGSGVTVGTWTLTWDKVEDTMVPGGVRFVGKWNFTEASKAGVTYVYEKADGVDRELPSDISSPETGADNYKVADSDQYYVGATVTRKNPAQASYSETDATGVVVGIWNLTWEKEEDTMVPGGVRFVGKWNFTETAKAGVTYVYEKADGVDRELPSDISSPETGADNYKVSDATQYYLGANVKRNNPAQSSYDEQDGSGVTVGTWTLTWDKVEDTMVPEGVRFVGKWNFTEASKAGVTYSYIAAPGTTRPLPSDISSPATPGDYYVADGTQYYVGASVTRNNPAQASYDEKDADGVTVGTWTLSWGGNDSATMDADGVHFVGEWTFAEAGKYNVTYQYANGSTRPLPSAIQSTTTPGDYQVGDSHSYYAGATANRNNPASDTYIEKDDAGIILGTWTVTWDKDAEIVTDQGALFTGTWNFTPAPQYGVTYQYTKADGVTRDLPAAISDTAAAGDYHVSDANTYYVDQVVTRQSPVQKTYDEVVDGVKVGQWTLTWEADDATMTDQGVTFVGKWSFTAYGSVRVHFVDQITGKPIKDPVTAVDTVFEGTDYDVTSFAPKTITVGDTVYELVSLKDGDSATGQVTAGTTNVTYVYKEVPKRGSVTIHFIDKTTGKPIKDPITSVTDQVVGTPYDVTGQASAEITVGGKRYRLVGLQSGKSSGQVTEGDTAIIYAYEEIIDPQPEPAPTPEPSQPAAPAPQKVLPKTGQASSAWVAGLGFLLLAMTSFLAFKPRRD